MEQTRNTEMKVTVDHMSVTWEEIVESIFILIDIVKPLI